MTTIETESLYTMTVHHANPDESYCVEGDSIELLQRAAAFEDITNYTITDQQGRIVYPSDLD